jgi:hypothetical protein
MPYSITTRDGITVDNIPDDVPADSPQLKDRVAKIRGGGAPAASAAPASDVKAPTSGIAMGLRDSVDAGAQMLRRAVPDSVGNAVDTFGNWLADKGLPVARSNGVAGVDKIVHDVNEQYDANRKANAGGQDPGFDGQRLVGNIANPVNYVGGGAAVGANTVRNLAIAGAKAGAVSGTLQPVTDTSKDDFWTQKAEQAGTGAIGGAIATPVAGKLIEKGATVLNNAVTRAPAANPQTIRIQVNNLLQQEGMRPGEVPQVILDSVQRQINEATQAGRRLDPNEILRRARFDAVGLTGDAAPTAGQLSRNPTQYANEINLSQVRTTNPQGVEGNALADRFNAQNRRLQDVFNNAGARQATDHVTAGQTIMDDLRRADQPVRGAVDDAYAAARAMSGGRAAPLDHGAFSQAANRSLDEGMLGHYVPPEIRNMLNDVTTGQQPFTVEAAEQFDSIMSAAQRRAGQGSPQSMAIGRIRQALHDAPFLPAEAGASRGGAAAAAARTVDDVNAPIQDVPFREAGPKALPAPANTLPAVRGGGDVSFQIPQATSGAGGAAAAADEGAAARQAFAQARAAARQRFATIEDTPALRAALDEEAPDKFVQRYILGANARDVDAMRQVLANSPEALAQARAQVADHLRRAAFGANVSGDKAFTPERYEGVLRAIGPQKLQAFFSPDEIVRFNLASRVASDMNSVPAGAKPNFSGTGGALFNLLSRIAEAPVVRQIPGARALANQVTEIRNERAINEALRPAVGGAQPPRQLTPQQVRAMQVLFPPAGVAGGVFGGAAVN